MTTRSWISAAALLLLAACSDRSDEATTPPQTEPAATAPAAVVESTPAPTASETPVDATAAAVRNDPALVNFNGYGSAAFGADEAQVRAAFGKPMTGRTEHDEAGCYYLMAEGDADQGLGFMMVDDKLARYDAWDASTAAPGDLSVGMRADDVLARFPGRVEQQPHKYDETGRYLIVSPDDGGPARLVFEVGGDGIVSAWRIGLPPAVHYVEGCS